MFCLYNNQGFSKNNSHVVETILSKAGEQKKLKFYLSILQALC